jgi:hypothetical protein
VEVDVPLGAIIVSVEPDLDIVKSAVPAFLIKK